MVPRLRPAPGKGQADRQGVINRRQYKQSPVGGYPRVGPFFSLTAKCFGTCPVSCRRQVTCVRLRGPRGVAYNGPLSRAKVRVALFIAV